MKLDNNLKNLGLNDRTINVLMINGINSVEQIISLGKSGISKTPNLGRNAVNSIFTVIEKNGLDANKGLSQSTPINLTDEKKAHYSALFSKYSLRAIVRIEGISLKKAQEIKDSLGLPENPISFNKYLTTLEHIKENNLSASVLNKSIPELIQEFGLTVHYARKIKEELILLSGETQLKKHHKTKNEILALLDIVRNGIGAGRTIEDISDELGISPHNIYRWMSRYTPNAKSNNKNHAKQYDDVVSKLQENGTLSKYARLPSVDIASELNLTQHFARKLKNLAKLSKEKK